MQHTSLGTTSGANNNNMARQSTTSSQAGFLGFISSQDADDDMFDFAISDIDKHKKPIDKPPKQSNCFITLCSSLRFKTISVLLLMFLLLMAICLAILVASFIVSFSNIEVQSAEDGSRRVTRALFDDFNSLATKLFEWAVWDTTADLLINNDPAAIDAFFADNLDCDYLQVTRINYAIMYHLNGSFIKGVACYRGQPIQNIPEELLELKSDSILLQGMTVPNTKKVGLLIPKQPLSELGVDTVIPESWKNILLTASMPITPNSLSESYGVFVFGKYENWDLVNDIASRTQLCLTMYNLDNSSDTSLLLQSLKESSSSSISEVLTGAPATIINGLTSVSNWVNDRAFKVSVLDGSSKSMQYSRQCWVDPSNNSSSATTGERMAAYQMFNDLNGSKGIVLRTDISRSVYQLGITSFLITWGVMTAAVIVLSITIVVFIEAFVLRRVIKLTGSVNSITTNNDVTQRVPKMGLDEVGILAKNVNRMLHQLELSQQKIEKENILMQQLLEKTSLEEQKSRMVMNAINDFIVTVECSSGLLININSAFESNILKRGRNKLSRAFSTAQLDNKTETVKVAGDRNSTQSQNPQAFYQTQCLDEYYKDVPLEDLKNKLEELCLGGQKASWETTLTSGFGIKVPVSVSASKVRMIIREGTIGDAYVIVAKNLSEQLELKQTLKQQQQQLSEMKTNAEFDRVMKDPILRLKFAGFCKKERSEENFLFLEYVEKYRSLSKTHERSQKQREIIDLFLKEDCEMPLNVAAKDAEIEVKKIMNGFGQIDLFDKLEGIVKAMMSRDTFNRFMIQLPTMEIAVNPTTSDTHRSSLDSSKSSTNKSTTSATASTMSKH
ncbi:hypothetical protein ABK040_009326 [Willaertia magna]